MTFEQRKDIFAKEVLTIKDFEQLFELSYDASAKLLRQIKIKFDRLGIEGRLHVEDYFEYFNITDRERYYKEII